MDPYGEAGVVAIFLLRLLAGETPVISTATEGTGLRLCDGRDAGQLLVLEGEWRGFRAYNVGTGLGIDVNQLEAGLRQALAKVLGEQGRDTELPAASYGPPRPGDLRSSLLDAGKIARELGWRPQVTLEEGLKRTAPGLPAGRTEEKPLVLGES